MSTARLTSKRQKSTLPHPSSAESNALADDLHTYVALERAFWDAERKSVRYIQFRGIGSPSLDLGRPGDIFVDLSPKLYRVFVRYDTWREWPGLHRYAGRSSEAPSCRFTHPVDSTRVMWCSSTDIMWYHITSIRKGIKRPFASHPNSLFVSAHELVSRSALSKEGLKIDRNGPSISTADTELLDSKKRKVMADALSDYPPSTEDHYIPQLLTASQRSLSAPLEAAQNDQALPSSTHCDGNSSLGVALVSSDLLQGEPTQTDHLPPSLTIPSSDSAIPSIEGEPSDNPGIISRQREFKASNGSTIWYTQLHGYGPPAAELGSPGDMFIDMTPNAYRLFVRYETWREWPGVYLSPTNDRFLHPKDKYRVVWCSQIDVSWYRTVSLSSARNRLFRSTAATFISANRMIGRSGILRRGIVAGVSHLHDGVARTVGNPDIAIPGTLEKSLEPRTPFHRNIDSNESCRASNGDEAIFQPPIEDSFQAVPIEATNAQTSLTPAAEDQKSGSGGNPTCARAPTRAPSHCSSALSSVPPSPSPSPTPPLPSLPAGSLFAEDLHSAMMIDGEHTDAVQEARINRRIKDHYAKRREKYLRRRDELLTKIAELSRHEKTATAEEQCARKRLEDAKRDALQRKEQIMQQEEELNREMAEIASLEKKVFHREQVLKDQREILRKIEETIVQWDSV